MLQPMTQIVILLFHRGSTMKKIPVFLNEEELAVIKKLLSGNSIARDEMQLVEKLESKIADELQTFETVTSSEFEKY